MKRFLCAMCALIIIFNLIPVPSFAEEVYPVKEIVFTYQSVNDYNAVCYYSDGYFSHSSYIYDPGLATMSMSLAMASFGSAAGGQTDYSDKSVNARKLLTEAGFSPDSIQVNEDFKKRPDYDSMGAIAGSKNIFCDGNTYTLIALALRGGGYEAEWANNFTLGEQGHHNGFDECKNNILDFLRSYTKAQDIKGNVKLWICGFSRSAAVANLLAGAIDDGAVISENIRCTGEDMYAYCFETPAVADTSLMGDADNYGNIFNFINKNGFISYFAPSSYGLSIYGKCFYMPTPESSPEDYTEVKARMTEVYDLLPDLAAYKVDNFKMKELDISGNILKGDISFSLTDTEGHSYTQSLFLSDTFSYYSSGIFCSREDYAKNHQEGLRELFGAIYGCTEKQYSAFVSALKDALANEFPSIASSLISGVRITAERKLGECFIQALDKAEITGYNEESIRKTGKTFVSMIMASGNDIDTLATFIDNYTTIKRAHYPELCYAWLASGDGNYFSDAHFIYNDGGYIKVKLEGTAGTTVTNEAGETVISTADSFSAYSYIYGTDKNGKEYFILPDNSYYRIIFPEDDSTDISLTFTRYSAALGRYADNICYFSLDPREAPVITLDKSGNISAEYKNGQSISPSAKQTLLTYHSVTAESSREDLGHASAEKGVFEYGEFVRCTATPCEGCTFAGWFQGETLISTEAVFDYCALGDTVLCARFYKDADFCDHAFAETINFSVATCTNEGYSGDTYCRDCNSITAEGEAIPTVSHNYINGICSVCSKNILPLPLRIAVYSYDIITVTAALATVIISIIRSRTENEKKR